MRARASGAGMVDRWPPTRPRARRGPRAGSPRCQAAVYRGAAGAGWGMRSLLRGTFPLRPGAPFKPRRGPRAFSSRCLSGAVHDHSVAPERGHGASGGLIAVEGGCGRAGLVQVIRGLGPAGGFRVIACPVCTKRWRIGVGSGTRRGTRPGTELCGEGHRWWQWWPPTWPPGARRGPRTSPPCHPGGPRRVHGALAVMPAGGALPFASHRYTEQQQGGQHPLAWVAGFRGHG
jgi:hypothetical protein